MPPATEPSYYDIDHLASALEAGHVVLTPNSRLARSIKQAWAARQSLAEQVAWPTPQVMSLQQWWERCYDRALLRGADLPLLATAQQELELWQQVIEAHPDSSALLRPRGAAQLARDAWHNLLLWQQDWRGATLAQEFRFDPDGALFLEWAKTFEQRLAQSGLAPLPALVPRLVDECRGHSLLLAEFDEVPPLYLALLQANCEDLRQHRTRGGGADCYLVACDDDEQELIAAAAWAAEEHRRDPQRRLGLVVPDLQHRRFSVERALRRGFAFSARHDAAIASASRSMPVNFSAGVPLASSGPVRAALQLLGLQVHDSRLPELVKLLHSRYRDQSELEQEQALIARLYRHGREQVSSGRLRHEASRVRPDQEQGLALGRALLALAHDRSLQGLRPAGEWPQLFSDALERLGWPGAGPLDSLEYQQLEQWQQVLETLRQFDVVTGSLDFRAALERLRQLCEAAVFQPQTEDARIQVLGLLEGAGQQYDALWICGMDAGSWPPPAAPNPFIPERLQKRLDMPHASAAREMDYARKLLDHYRSSSALMIASYTRMRDSVEQQPSALLEDFDSWPGNTAPEPLPVEWLDLQRQCRREQLEDKRAPALEEATDVAGGATILESQSQCPFRAFARHRLAAEPLPALSLGLTAAERGTLLHSALFHLWGELGDRASLAALSPGQRSERAAAAAAVATDDFRISDDQVLGRSLLELERQRLRALLERWLEVELERPDFSVIARESDTELKLGPLQLKLRLDRVDRLADGRELIIDYKSGESAVGQWLGFRPDSPQLPMYGEVAGPELEGLAFAIINRRHQEFRGVGLSELAPGVRTDIEKLSSRREPQLEDWDSLRRHWSETLLRLARDFADGRAEVDPVDPRTTCTYCGLEPLCRVQ